MGRTTTIIIAAAAAIVILGGALLFMLNNNSERDADQMNKDLADMPLPSATAPAATGETGAATAPGYGGAPPCPTTRTRRRPDRRATESHRGCSRDRRPSVSARSLPEARS